MKMQRCRSSEMDILLHFSVLVELSVMTISYRWGWSTYVVTSEDSQVKGKQLERDDAQDALQAVHTVRHIDGAARVLGSLEIVFVTDHDGAALWIKQRKSFLLLVNQNWISLSWFSHLLKFTSATDY